jgi:Fibronectin type III domain
MVASGDSGSEGCNPGATSITEADELAVSDPASSPFVTAVGGSDTATVTGTQYVWNTSDATALADCASNTSDCAPGATGGGLSTHWDQPTYQPTNATLQTGCVSGGGSDGQFGGTTNGGCREVPDVSALAGYNYWEMCTSTGTAGTCPFGGTPGKDEFFYPAYGTSLAAPSWAGTIALADNQCGANLGFLNQTLYGDTGSGNPDVGSVTAVGNNDFTGTNGGDYPTFADGGQNLATGLGYLGGVDLSSGVLCQVPSPPMAVTPALGAAGSQAATVSWTQSTYSGRSPITGYTVTAFPGGASCTATAPTTSCTVSGLTNGSVYRFTVTATNTQGTSRPSAPSSWVSPVPSFTFHGFSGVSGAAGTISEGNDGSVWVLGTGAVAGGHPLFEWNPTTKTWTLKAGGAVAIADDQNGQPWIVNNAHAVFHWNGSSWVYQPNAQLTSISVGAGGTVWGLGISSVAGGYPVFELQGSSWVYENGGGVSLAVGSTGTPWLVNNGGSIFQLTGSAWSVLPGQAAAIAEGGNGTAAGAVWVLGTGSVAGGHPIFNWNGTNWTYDNGGAIGITVGPADLPWVVNNAGHIFQGN